MFQHFGDAEQEGKMREFAAANVDNQIRIAIGSCWLSLPVGRRSLDELETQMRRLVERALRDFRDDWKAFGLVKPED
jgi:hypothetical protein